MARWFHKNSFDAGTANLDRCGAIAKMDSRAEQPEPLKTARFRRPSRGRREYPPFSGDRDVRARMLRRKGRRRAIPRPPGRNLPAEAVCRAGETGQNLTLESAAAVSSPAGKD